MEKPCFKFLLGEEKTSTTQQCLENLRVHEEAGLDLKPDHCFGFSWNKTEQKHANHVFKDYLSPELLRLEKTSRLIESNP